MRLFDPVSGLDGVCLQADGTGAAVELQEQATGIAQHLAGFVPSPEGSSLRLTVLAHGAGDIGLGGGGTVVDVGGGLGVGMHGVTGGAAGAGGAAGGGGGIGIEGVDLGWGLRLVLVVGSGRGLVDLGLRRERVVVCWRGPGAAHGLAGLRLDFDRGCGRWNVVVGGGRARFGTGSSCVCCGRGSARPWGRRERRG